MRMEATSADFKIQFSTHLEGLTTTTKNSENPVFQDKVLSNVSEARSLVLAIYYLGFKILTAVITYLLTPWSYSASDLYEPSNRRLSAKLVPTSAVRWSVMSSGI
jgi:hypothetical protein